jgi:predicted CXXCH cytochrome family protein
VPGLDAKTGQFSTHVGELGIACEACHGPGEEHILANRDPLRRYRLHWSGQGDPTIVQPEKLDHERSSQICGQCHGVYIMRNEFAMKYAFEGVLFRPGDDLFRTRYYIQHPTRDSAPKRQQDLQTNPQFFQERWWDDGTVLAGGREFTALIGSACYQRGEISCLSCHTMHGGDPTDQLRPELSAEQSCTQCHTQPQYTLDLPRHTHHGADSVGSDCLNCHMPHTTYALLGAIRNHEISSPRVRPSAAYGVPNACNLCHLDRTLAWTQDHLKTWYGTEPVELTDEQRRVSAAVLWLIKGHAAQRVVTAWHFGWDAAQQASGRNWLAPFVAQLLADPYGVVRYVARDALLTLPGFEQLDYDFLAPQAELDQQVVTVVARWRREQDRPLEPASQLLIDPQGELDRAALESLLRQRDNRPVTIKE